jgi:hypothetical protein
MHGSEGEVGIEMLLSTLTPSQNHALGSKEGDRILEKSGTDSGDLRGIRGNHRIIDPIMTQ